VLGAPVTRVALAEKRIRGQVLVSALTQPARMWLACALGMRVGSAGPRCARFGVASVSVCRAVSACRCSCAVSISDCLIELARLQKRQLVALRPYVQTVRSQALLPPRQHAQRAHEPQLLSLSLSARISLPSALPQGPDNSIKSFAGVRLGKPGQFLVVTPARHEREVEPTPAPPPTHTPHAARFTDHMSVRCGHTHVQGQASDSSTPCAMHTSWTRAAAPAAAA
jgi:hypothetical protein